MAELRRYHQERPLGAQDAPPELTGLAEELSRWILEEAPRDRLSVLALLGARGAGKTSMMNALLGRLAEHKAVRLPKPSDTRDPSPAAFDLGICDPDGDLLFDLLAYLERSYVRGGSKEQLEKVLKETRWHAARRADPERFLALIKDTAPSADVLREQLADEMFKVARVDDDLREQLGRLIDRILERPGDDTTLIVLPVDDLDLLPNRALDLLDLLNRFLSNRPVLVLLGAHEDHLLAGLQQNLADDKRALPGLDRALYDKLVWRRRLLPRWSAERCYALLRDVQEYAGSPVQPLLPRLWEGLDDARLRAATEDMRLRLQPFGSASRALAADATVESLSKEQLLPLLPDTPRLTKALHNRWVDELEPSEDARRRERLDSLVRWLGVSAPFARWMTALVLAADQSEPEWGLWTRWRDQDPRLLEELSEQGELLRLAWQEAPDDSDRVDRASLLRRVTPWQPGEVEESARRGRWAHLVAALVALRQGGTLRRQRLLVSVDADAAAVARDNLPAISETLHLDLRATPGEARPPMDELRRRLEEKREEISKLTSGAPLEVFARAPLSLLAWLGWTLRYRDVALAWNLQSGQKTAFPLPPRRLRPNGAREPRVLRQHKTQNHQSRDSKEVVLAIDLLGHLSWGEGPGGQRVLNGLPEALALLPICLLQRRGQVLQPSELTPGLIEVLNAIEALTQHDTTRTVHLLLACPDVFAFALGRQLHMLGLVKIYEYNRNTGIYESGFELTGDQPPDAGGAFRRSEPEA